MLLLCGIVYLRRGIILGVDVALNSLAGEKMTATINLVARDGHFLEIGKFDLSQNSQLGRPTDKFKALSDMFTAFNAK